MTPRKSFQLYLDYATYFKMLPDEEKGKLIDAIFDYVTDGKTPENLSPMCLMAFTFIKNQYDRDDKKYQEVCKRNLENGKLGGRPRKNDPDTPDSSSASPDSDTHSSQTTNNESPKTQNNRTVSEKTERFFKKPKKPDKDIDTDKDTVKDTGTDTDKDTHTEKETEIETGMDMDTDTDTHNETQEEIVPEMPSAHTSVTLAKNATPQQNSTSALAEKSACERVCERENPTNDSNFPQKFERFWQAYPKHVGLQKAYAEFARLAPDDNLLSHMLEMLEKHKTLSNWQGEVRYIPNPATWLSGRRWEDELDEKRPFQAVLATSSGENSFAKSSRFNNSAVAKTNASGPFLNGLTLEELDEASSFFADTSPEVSPDSSTQSDTLSDANAPFNDTFSHLQAPLNDTFSDSDAPFDDTFSHVESPLTDTFSSINSSTDTTLPCNTATSANTPQNDLADADDEAGTDAKKDDASVKSEPQPAEQGNQSKPQRTLQDILRDMNLFLPTSVGDPDKSPFLGFDHSRNSSAVFRRENAVLA